MSTKSNNFSGHFTSTLTLIFITLKLTGVIDWSWWLVLGPLWMPLAFIVTVIGPIWLILVVIEAKREKKFNDIQMDQDIQDAMQGFGEETKH